MRFLIILSTLVALTQPSISSAISLGNTSIRVIPSKNTLKDGNIRDLGFIEITGDIRSAAVPALVDAIEQAKLTTGSFTVTQEPIVRILINSRGGEVAGAMRMGKIIRTHAAEVWVEAKGECSSACILVLAAGIFRNAIPGAKLGIHRPYFRPEEFSSLSLAESQEKYAALTSATRHYLSLMGVSDRLFEAMINVPSRKIKYISHKFAEDTNLTGEDPGYSEWQRSKDIKALGPDRLLKFDQYIDCVNSGRSMPECSRFISSW